MQYCFKFFLLVAAAILVFPVHAAAPTEGGLHMVCLTAHGEQGNHTTTVTGSPFYPDKKIEIWRKVNGQFEQAGYGDHQSTFTVLNATANQIIGNFEGKLSVDTDGSANTKEPEAPVLVKSWTTESTTHTFYGVQQIGVSALSAEQTALKLTTFFPPVGGQSSCVTVHWDPYGTAFDTVSLEPILGASVALYRDSIIPANLVPEGPGISQNPYRLKADGMFTFIVADGNYFLKPTHSSHTYPAPLSEITRLSSAQTIYTDLYTGGVIEQSGTIQHRDIPMVPVDPTNPTQTTPVIAVDLTTYCVGTTCYQLAYGTCSHPKCIVRAYSNNKLIPGMEKEVLDDRSFEMEINMNLIDQTLPLEFRGEKKPLTPVATPTPVIQSAHPLMQFLNTLMPVAHAQQTSVNQTSNTVRLYPIPNYLEGYVYTKDLRTANNAKINIVIPSMDNRVVVTIQAEPDGFIKIPDSLIPPAQFEIQVLNEQNQIVNSISTNKFVTLNKAYLTRNNINLFTPQKPVIDEKNGYSKIVVDNANPQNIPFTGAYENPLTPTPAPTTATTNTLWPLIVLGLTLAIGISVMILIYVRANKHPPLA